MAKARRNRVGEFEVGQKVEHEGKECIIDGFPSRRMVTLKRPNPISGEWASAKTSIREIKKI